MDLTQNVVKRVRDGVAAWTYDPVPPDNVNGHLGVARRPHPLAGDAAEGAGAGLCAARRLPGSVLIRPAP